MVNINEVVYAINGLVIVTNIEEKTSYIVSNYSFKTVDSLIAYTTRLIGDEVEQRNASYYEELNNYRTEADFKSFKKQLQKEKYTVYTKYRNQAFAKMFGGVPPKTVASCLNGLIYKIYIEPIKHLAPLYNYCQNKRMVKLDHILNKAINRTECILSFEQNVSAFGLIFNNPQEAKKGLGKGLWKSLCSNSNNKNCLIMSHTMEAIKNGSELKTTVEGLNKLASTWLNRFRNLNISLPARFVTGNRVSECWLKQLQKPGESLNKMFSPGRIKEVVRDYYYIQDTFSLACEVNGPFDPSWSLRKMQETHDRYVLNQVVKESSPDRFIGLDSSNVPENIEDSGFKATLLSSLLDYATERELQQHCIYTYAERAKRLEYFAYKIEGPNGFRSTLGFDEKGLHIQHYKKHNQAVVESDAVVFAAKILKNFGLEQKLSLPGEDYWDDIEF